MSTVLITGANRGIGLGFATQYLSRGWEVIAACRRPLAATALHRVSEQHPSRLTLLAMDVEDEASIAAAHKAVEEQTLILDVLINNAGVLHPSTSVWDVTPEALRSSLAVNTIGPFLVGNQFADLLLAGGKLVQITMPTPSVTRWVGASNHAYAASRYALNILTKMQAMELAERGVITVGLYPGFLQTDMNQHSVDATPVAEGVPLAVKVIDGLAVDDTGKCFLPDGSTYEW